MLPSHLGGAASGNGAASGQGSTMAGSGSSSSGVSLVRSGLSGRPGNGGGMLGGNAAGASRMSMMGNSGGSSRPGNGAGLSGIPGVIGGGVIGGGLPMCHSGRYDPDREGSAAGYSGSDADSDSGDEDDLGDRRGVKRGVTELDLGIVGQDSGMGAVGYSGVPGGVAGAKPGKKTRGRVKIKMEFIDNKLRRYTTFSKRKTGIMKKAYELSTLTGTQVLLLVASETGHVYTFATRKLQPMITSETGKALIQTCLNSPDSPPRSDPSTDQRMSATGFEETDLTYQVSESDSSGETKDTLKPTFTVANLPGATTSNQTAPTTSTTMQVSSGHSFPITNYLAPVSTSGSPSVVTSANGTILKTAGGGTVTSTGVMQLPAGFTIMPGTPLPPGTPTIPFGQLQTHALTISGQQGQTNATSSGQAQHGQQTFFRFPGAGGQLVSLAGGAVAQQVPVQAIQVHQTAQSNSASDGSGEITTTSGTGGIPQVFLTGPPGTVQIPVQLHQMTVIGQQPGGSSNLTELQVVNLDTAHNCKSE
ncbi:serum response factor isoform X3 [Protopterus annectens]|uniref:serum response factor isoform X3 n=1 Tax=Protopterus annectens TaxID=7888 RepID=UPI001CF9AC9F|nr:serum response factor isoform X3 [Protopterus annectens]